MALVMLCVLLKNSLECGNRYCMCFVDLVVVNFVSRTKIIVGGVSE